MTSLASPEIRQFRASDGYAFHFRHWRVEPERVRGIVVLLHGIQSHGGWYEYSCGKLCESGFDVRLLDRRGSGLNQEARGDVRHYQRLVHDVVQFLRDIRADQAEGLLPLCPLVLVGISWGGKLATYTAARRPELVDALGLMYPGIRAKIRPSKLQQLGVALSAALGGSRVVRIPLDDPALFTSDPGWQEFIRSDPLALRTCTTSFINASLRLDRLAAAAAENIKVPCLLQLAGQDEIIDNASTRRLAARMRPGPVIVVEYPDAAHTLEFEADRDVFVEDFLRWLKGISPRSQFRARYGLVRPKLTRQTPRSASNPSSTTAGDAR